MKIKNPTIRKVRNRGFEPVNYYTDYGEFACWIEKVGRLKLWVRFPDGKMKKVPMAERLYMRAI